jgi:hypothetical protein
MKAIITLLVLPLCFSCLAIAGERFTPEKRHPGHTIEATFIPKQDSYRLGESVEVVLKIDNIGDADFKFMRGGRQRGSRDNQFAFSAQQNDRMLPDIGNPIHFGGLGAYVHLKPGQSVEIPVDLTKWFRFEKPGRIMLRGSYYMGFSDPSQAGYSFIWEDFACAEFSIQMKENG